MAAKKGKKKQATGKKSGSPAMEFIQSSLRARPSSSYGEIAEAAKKKGMTIYPVMYGRAQTLVGLVKAKKRRPAGSVVVKAARRGRPPGPRAVPGRRGLGSDVAAFLKNYELLREEHTALRGVLESVQREIARALR